MHFLAGIEMGFVPVGFHLAKYDHWSDHSSLLDLVGFLTKLLHVWDSHGDVNVLFPSLLYFQGNIFPECNSRP